jgi:hypothetical protein
MNYDYNNIYNQVYTNTPETAQEFEISDLVEKIFSNEPQPKGSLQMLSDETDGEFLFQTLLNITFEGLFFILEKNGNNNLSFDDIKSTTDPLLIKINEYLHSMNFELLIKSYEAVDNIINDNNNLNKWYCMVKKNNLPNYFIEYATEVGGHDRYNKKFMFTMNPHFYKTVIHKTDNLNDMELETAIMNLPMDKYYAIFVDKHNEYVYKLSFKFLL